MAQVIEASLLGTSAETEAPSATGQRVGKARRFRRNIGMYVSIVMLVTLTIAAFLAPFLPLDSPTATNVSEQYLRPFSPGHLLGTDSLGRDLLSRALYGARISIFVAIVAVFSGLVIGGTLGLIAGYRRGWLDSSIMRSMDVVLAFPSLIFAIAITAYLGASIRNVIIAIAFFTIPAYARLARATALRVGAQDFVLASKLMGQRSSVVLWKHFVPNALPSLLAFGLVNLAVAILIEASLSFLGLGLRPPTPSWGVMISEGRANMLQYPHLVLVPGAFLFFTLLCINLISDGVRNRAETSRGR
jgi:peptide/nickel transport system permease protein